MTAVVDASYAVAAIWEDSNRDRVNTIFDGSMVVPTIFLTEVAHAAVRMVRRRRLSTEAARSGLRDLSREIRITRAVSELVAFDVAALNGISVYDATYLACAKALDVPLRTLDRRLAEVAAASGVTVLP